MTQQEFLHLTADWRDELSAATPEAALVLLPKVERYAMSEERAWQPCLQWVDCAQFAVRRRALLTVGRLGDGTAVPALVERVHATEDTVQKLMLLDALLMLADRTESDPAAPLAPLLACQRDDVFLRGLIWYMGMAGWRSNRTTLAFLDAYVLATNQLRRIRDEVVQEAVFFSAGCSPQFLQQNAQNSLSLRRWLLHRVLKEGPYRPAFGIYPNPDYLLLEAAKHGVDAESFRRLYHWDRDKTTAAQFDAGGK